MATQTKSKRLDVRVSPEDDAVIRAAASKRSQSVSEFLIESALVRAEIEIANRTQVVLDDASWNSFVADLDGPAAVNSQLSTVLDRAKAAADAAVSR
ncbi:MAG: DUF1778 domain-containing protein [Solirubrobacterales bacterium]